MRDHDSPKEGVEVLCHLIFHGEEFDIEKIRSLVVLLNSTQLIDKILWMGIPRKRLQK